MTTKPGPAREGAGATRAWRILGVLIVAAATALAVILVLVLKDHGAPSKEPRHRRQMTAARPAGKPFNFCADRAAVFSGRTPFVGITLGADYPKRLDCALGLAAATHLGYVREDLVWATTEPVPGQYDFSSYDAFVAKLAEHHQRVLPLLITAPSWDTTAPASGARPGLYPPASPAQFAQFAAVCVRRYGPHGSFWRAHPKLPYYPATAWQVWNEPDLTGNWQPRFSPAAYVRLLRASYKSIKAADPHATVVTAGFFFATAALERSILTELFEAGMAGAFDALSIHTYSPIQAPLRLELARQLMDRFGAAKAGLWSTELAWASGGPDPWVSDPRSQASAIRSYFGWVARNRARLNLRELFWYSLEDNIFGPDPDWWRYHLGLLTTTRQPKPALAALSAAAAKLDG